MSSRDFPQHILKDKNYNHIWSNQGVKEGWCNREVSLLHPTSLLSLKDVYMFCAKLPTVVATVEPMTIVKSTNSEKDVGIFNFGNSGIEIFSCWSSPGLTEIIYNKI